MTTAPPDEITTALTAIFADYVEAPTAADIHGLTPATLVHGLAFGFHTTQDANVATNSRRYLKVATKLWQDAHPSKQFLALATGSSELALAHQTLLQRAHANCTICLTYCPEPHRSGPEPQAWRQEVTTSALLERLATAAALENKQIVLEILGDYDGDPASEDDLYEGAAGWLDKSARSAVQPLSEAELWELITCAVGNFAYYMEMRHQPKAYSRLEFLQEAATAVIVDRAITLVQE